MSNRYFVQRRTNTGQSIIPGKACYSTLEWAQFAGRFCIARRCLPSDVVGIDQFLIANIERLIGDHGMGPDGALAAIQARLLGQYEFADLSPAVAVGFHQLEAAVTIVVAIKSPVSVGD